MADWSGLPRDLLGKILERLSLIDHLCFEAVCVSWGLAVRDRHHRPKPQSPWLVHAAPSAADHAITFLTLSDKKKLYNSGPVISQRLRGKLCIGSSPRGHLVTVDSTASAHLLNPLTGSQIPLPPVTTMPFPSVEAVFDSSGRLAEYLMEPLCSRSGPHYLAPEKLRDLYVSKVVVSSSSSFTVAAIHGVTLGRLCYAKAGDTKWSPLASPGHFRDLIFHAGLLYTLSHAGLIESWDLDSPLPEPTAAVDATPADRLLRREGNHFHKYLVEVAGELVQVWRERQFTVHDEQRITRFRVFTLNEKRSRWVGSKGLPEHAVFVGHNTSFSLSTRDFPELKGNCIYFTDDLLDDVYRGGPHQPLDLGVYNLMDGSIERFYPPESLFDWPPPIWFTPSLQ